MSINRLGYLDAKREEFRRYLEESGVMDAFTKVLVSLYEEPEKPKDALEYVKKHLGDDRPEVVEFESMKAELEEYKARMKLLESEIEELRKRTGDLEPQVAFDGLETGRTPSQSQPGRTSSQLEPGRTSGQFEPGRTSGQYEPGRTSGQYEPGRTSGQYEPGRTSGQYEPGRTSGQFEPGRTSSHLEPELEKEKEELVNE